MVRSVSVTLAMALTTTTGCCDWRPATIEVTRSMALASSTEVPPNFITIIGASSKVSLGLEEFGVEDGGSGRAADRIVREHGEFPVEDATGAQPSHHGSHAGSHFHVETRLGTIIRF